MRVRVWNPDHPALKLGAEYVVLEVCVYPHGVLLRLDDEHGPGLWEAGQFETIDAAMPPNWSAATNARGGINIAPAAWREPGFWEAFFDGDLKARRAYERERAVIMEADGGDDAGDARREATEARGEAVRRHAGDAAG
jgi:hypothetical protein